MTDSYNCALLLKKTPPKSFSIFTFFNISSHFLSQTLFNQTTFTSNTFIQLTKALTPGKSNRQFSIPILFVWYFLKLITPLYLKHFIQLVSGPTFFSFFWFCGGFFHMNFMPVCPSISDFSIPALHIVIYPMASF